MNKRSISNQADKEFIDRVVQYYGLKNEKMGESECSYGKFIRTLLKEYNALKEIIDSS